MKRAFMDTRTYLGFLLSCAIGIVAFYRWPFPEDNALLELLRLQSPYVYYGIKCSYHTMLFTTPYIALAVLSSLAYIFSARSEKKPGRSTLPTYPESCGRNEL